MISQLPCLTAEEGFQIQDTLYRLKPYWESRIDQGIPFYTMGTASHIDAKEKGEFFYKMKAKKLNPLLEKSFSDLYKKVILTLEKEIRDPFLLEETYALPGFHIVNTESLKSSPAHFDLQFQNLKWKYQNVNEKRALSITLPITLPENGEGMFYWDIHYSNVKHLSKEQIEKKSEQEEPVYLNYSTGQILVYDSMLLHQAAPCELISQKDQCIMLQGHALYCDGAWRMYW